MSENLGIRAYYERAGYRHRGDLETPRWRTSLYERDLEVAGPPLR